MEKPWLLYRIGCCCFLDGAIVVFLQVDELTDDLGGEPHPMLGNFSP